MQRSSLTTPGFDRTITVEDNDRNTIDMIVNKKQLNKAIKQLQNCKAPGIDGIKNEMIRSSWESIEEPITHVY